MLPRTDRDRSILRSVRRHAHRGGRGARSQGLYRKARRGELANFTGVDSPYETPTSPDVRIDTTELTPEHAADRIVEVLRERGVIS